MEQTCVNIYQQEILFKLKIFKKKYVFLNDF